MTVVTHSLDDPETHTHTREATAAPTHAVASHAPRKELRHEPPGDRPLSNTESTLPDDESTVLEADSPEAAPQPMAQPEHLQPVQMEPKHSPIESTVTLPERPQPEPAYSATIDLAARDVRMVLQEQREQSQTLITKLNILFVANGALLSSLTISRLMTSLSPFTLAEALEFIISFALLVRAFLPRQVAVSPNLEDRKFLERYLGLSAEQYQLQMLVNLAETYNANKQRLDDISQTLVYAAYATLSIAITVLLHMLLTYSGWYSTA